MRTTIDVPSGLMRAAKARAAERGESLKDLVTRAVARELDLPSVFSAKAGRVTLPLIGRGVAPETLVMGEDIAAALHSDDVDRHGAS